MDLVFFSLFQKYDSKLLIIGAISGFPAVDLQYQQISTVIGGENGYVTMACRKPDDDQLQRYACAVFRSFH